MKGALAAGHPLTAEAGADVLRAGGNAVDACIAAAAVSWICESPLTGPGGGGFLLVHRAAEGRARLLDFFVAMPGARRLAGRARRARRRLRRLAADLLHGPDVRGRAGRRARPLGSSCPLGLGAVGGADRSRRATRARGRRPQRGRRRSCTGSSTRCCGTRPRATRCTGRAGLSSKASAWRCPSWRRRSNRSRSRGPAASTAASSRSGSPAYVPITLADLARYEVIEREPLAASYRGEQLWTCPSPSNGGRLLKVGLDALGDEADPTPLAVVQAMEAQDAARTKAIGGTTHISAVDGNGDAASLSCSLGSSGGVVVPGIGIQLNNMLGETHLVGEERPGARMMSLMAPSLLLRDGAPRLVVGSAGSTRLHGAMLQVTANVAARGLGVADGGRRAAAPLREGRRALRGRGGGGRAGGGRLPRRPLAAAQPVLRRRLGGGDPGGRLARGGGRSSAGRRCGGGRGMSFRIRHADPSDAEQLARLADAVSAEPEGWLISVGGRVAKRGRRAPLPQGAAPVRARGGLRGRARRRRRSSAGSRSGATLILRARTSPTSA